MLYKQFKVFAGNVFLYYAAPGQRIYQIRFEIHLRLNVSNKCAIDQEQRQQIKCGKKSICDCERPYSQLWHFELALYYVFEVRPLPVVYRYTFGINV